MNNFSKYNSLEPIVIIILIYIVGAIFQIIPALNLFSGQSSIVLMVLVLFTMMFFSKGNFKIYGFKKTKLKTYIFSIIITFMYVLIYTVITIYFLHILPKHTNDNNHPLVLKILTLFIFAPISEELMFRGYLQTNLVHLNNKGIYIFNIFINLSIIITAFLFGMFHFGILLKEANLPYTFSLVLYTFLLGIISGYFKEKSGSIYPSIAIHSFANIISGIFVFILIRINHI